MTLTSENGQTCTRGCPPPTATFHPRWPNQNQLSRLRHCERSQVMSYGTWRWFIFISFLTEHDVLPGRKPEQSTGWLHPSLQSSIKPSATDSPPSAWASALHHTGKVSITFCAEIMYLCQSSKMVQQNVGPTHSVATKKCSEKSVLWYYPPLQPKTKFCKKLPKKYPLHHDLLLFHRRRLPDPSSKNSGSLVQNQSSWSV